MNPNRKEVHNNKIIKIAITGNPGVGKHTCGKIVAKKMNANIFDVNKRILVNNAILKNGNNHLDGIEINIQKARTIIKKELAELRTHTIIIGHLIPYIIKPNEIDFVAVLRRSPYLLRKTFIQRGYTISKINENTASEILGICFYDTLKVFGKNKILELDTTRYKPETIAQKILLAYQNKSKRQVGKVDWLKKLLDNNDVKEFLEYN